ncbi:MAG: hypothetical protein KDB94_08680 [Acidobacteria bacterium]|nr:hypothetical protein [Acidobacteriota bacterium]
MVPDRGAVAGGRIHSSGSRPGPARIAVVMERLEFLFVSPAALVGDLAAPAWS